MLEMVIALVRMELAVWEVALVSPGVVELQLVYDFPVLTEMAWLVAGFAGLGGIDFTQDLTAENFILGGGSLSIQ